jgi:phosphoglycerate dehydrogenase-like enzyme
VSKPVLLVAERRRFTAAAALTATFDVRLADLRPDELTANLADVDALWVRLRFRIDAATLAAAPRLRWLATPTTGLTHLDEDALARARIRLVCLRGEVDFLRNVRATAEHTVLLALALLRRLVPAAAHAVGGGWNRDAFRGGELAGRRVGLVGLGRVGTQVAGLLAAFGADVAAADPAPASTVVPLLPLDALLARSDLVCLHVALDAGTAGLVDRDFLDRMRPGALLVNTARGELVDEAAVLDALDRDRLGGYATDVLSGERSHGNGDHPIVRRALVDDRVLVTPHLGGCTGESMAATEQFLARRLVDAASG